jgi:hypothetical protein
VVFGSAWNLVLKKYEFRIVALFLKSSELGNLNGLLFLVRVKNKRKIDHWQIEIVVPAFIFCVYL